MSNPQEGVGRDQSVEIPLPPRRKVYVRLEDLPSADGEPGKRTLLKSPSARTLKLTRQWDQDRTQVDLLWEIAASLLPDLTPDEVEALTADSVVRVIDLANQPIAELEAIAKNGGPPLAKAAKGSSSVIPSSTRSRGSRSRTSSPSQT